MARRAAYTTPLVLLVVLFTERYIPAYAKTAERELAITVPLCTTGIYCCDLVDDTIIPSQLAYDFTDRVGCVSLFSNTCNNTQLDASFCECGAYANEAGTTGDGWYYNCDTNQCTYDTTHTGIKSATGDMVIMESHYHCAVNKVASGILGLGKALLGVIIGGVIGGIILLILLCVCVAKCCCKPKVVVVQGNAVDPK